MPNNKNSIVEEVKASVKAKKQAEAQANKAVFTRTQIAWATIKIAAFITLGIVIGVYSTNMVNQYADNKVSSEVAQLKENQ